MHARALAVLAGLLAFAGTAAQAQHPDLTGIYKLDKAASRSDPSGPGFSDIERGALRIERRGGGLFISITMVSRGSAEPDTVTLVPDGRESVLEGDGTRQVTSTVWSGDTLVSTIRMTSGAERFVSSIRFCLVDGGRALEMRRRRIEPPQTFEPVAVFRRTPAVGGRP